MLFRSVNFALSYVINRVFGSKPPQQQDNGVRQQIPPSTENTIPIVYGDAWLGGTFVDAVLSTDAKTMYYVLVISHISPNGQFSFDQSKFYYGDRTVAFDGTDLTKVVSLTDGAGNVDTKISGNLYINLYTSNASGTITSTNGAAAPSSVMGGADITSTLRWPSTGRQMNGLAFAIIKLTYNRDAGTTGLQPVTFKCAHYLSSTGAAKPGDVIYDYLTSTIYGGAVPAGNVNSTACTALNTYSDQTITYTPSGGGSATQVRYRINGVVNTGETILNNVDKILTACDSWISYQSVSGQWTPIVNKADSTGFAFDDTNIMGEIRVSATDISQSINQIEVSFPWKENKDQPGYIYLKTPTILLYPNEPVNKYTGSFDFVNDSVQAQYLANRILEQAREDLIVSFSTAYPGIQVNVGDVVSVTNDAYGWSAKLFRVMKVTEIGLPDGGLGAQFELNEYNANVYDDGSITAFTPAPNSNLASAYYFPALSAPTVGDQLPNAALPTFSVTCQLPSTARVTTVTLYYTTSATPSTNDWKVWGSQTASNSQAFTSGLALKFPDINLASNTYYFAFTVSNEFGTSALSSVSSSFVWSPAVQGATVLYSTTPSSAVTVTGVSSTPDGYPALKNTPIVSVTFTAPFTGTAQLIFNGLCDYTNSSSTNTGQLGFSLQNPALTYNGWNRINVTVPAGANGAQIAMNTTRTWSVTFGTSYTFTLYANKFLNADTVSISNMQLIASVSNA